MTDFWDFSDLIQSWNINGTQVSEPKEDEQKLVEQMQKEVQDINNLIEKIQTNDTESISELGLLTIPKIPEVSLSVGVLSGSDEKIVENPEKINVGMNDKPVAMTTTKNISQKSPRIIKPKTPQKTLSRTFEKSGKIAAEKSPSTENLKPVFKATPANMEVVNFHLFQLYSQEFYLQNVDFKTHGFQVKFPDDPAFSVRFEDSSVSSRTISGLGIKFTVNFKPTNPQDYDQEIVFIPDNGAQPTIVKLHCYRDPPRLKHPDIVDLGATLVHSLKPGKFTIKNDGGIAFFSFSSPTGRDDNMMFTNGSFTLIPSQFQLQHGESKEIEVKFRPVEPGKHTASFEIVAEHFPQKFSFLAVGEAAVPDLRFSISDDTRLFLPFLPEDVNTTRVVEIVNKADVQYPFYVQILSPREGTRSDLAILYPGTNTQTVKNMPPPFIVSPLAGMVGAHDKITLKVTFSPKMFAFYKANIVISANRIPDETGKQTNRKMLTIAAEGTTGPPRVLIQPPLVLFNSVVPHVETTESIDVVNESNLDIKLQWHKSNTISPSPLVFNVQPNNRAAVDLICNLTKRIGLAGENHSPIKSVAMTCSTPGEQRPSSRHYSISMSAFQDENEGKVTEVNENGEDKVGELNENGEEDKNEKDEMPNIFALKHWSSEISKSELSTSVTNLQLTLDMQDESMRAKDDVKPVPPENSTPMNFTFATHVLQPNLVLDPPVIEFGSVLTGTVAKHTLTLINNYGCPIVYVIEYPHDPAWNISKPKYVVQANSKEEVPMELKFDTQTALSDIITLHTWWCNKSGTPIDGLPHSTFAIPVFAIFDSPIIAVDKRIVDIGEVYPTVVYDTEIKISLMNSFPTQFNVECPSGTTQLKLQGPEDESIEETEIDSAYYVQASPSVGKLDLGGEQIIKLRVCFAELGDRAMPIKIKILGKTYTVAVIAKVVAPKVSLLTRNVDFSSDFVICKESKSLIHIANECEVESTVRMQMINDCNKVFMLGDSEVKSLGGMKETSIPVSCYSEIHGDYNGKLKLIIRDLWQYKEIDIPLHVKALGSFFGFQKHTFGYTQNPAGDFVSFGTKIDQADAVITRCLSLVNFSSAPIQVQWSLANFVHGRNYVDVLCDINDKGELDLQINEAEGANLQSPFSLETHETEIESHGKRVVEIKLDTSQKGEFRGCVAARSGEFIHTLGLYANIV